MEVGSKTTIRLAGAVLLAGAVWLAAYYIAPWVAAIVAFIGLAFVAGVIGDRAPAVSERVLGTDPLAIAVGSDIGFYSDAWSVALPGDIDDRTTPPQGLHHLQARSHLVEAGAFDLGKSHLLLALEGRSADPVRITEIRARVRARFKPLSGAVITSQSAGENRIVPGDVDLDKDEAPLTEDGRPYFHDYFVTLGRGEFWQFRIVGKVTGSACDWELVVSYIHRGEAHELILENSGKPFRTTAKADQDTPAYLWAWHENPARVVAATDPPY